MPSEREPWLGRPRAAWLCAGYAALMLYSSTVIGPGGLHFVYRDPALAFRAFLATPYVMHGSDQRADWMGNLLMLAPFGFLLTTAFWPKRAIWALPVAVAILGVAETTILGIKYVQLFFPPRTVTLNYILAQTLGVMAGSVAGAVWQGRVLRPGGAAAARVCSGSRLQSFASGSISTRPRSEANGIAIQPDPVRGLVLGLWLYTGALCLFVLMPLDFALDAADLRAVLARLPITLLAVPGFGPPVALRVVVIVMATLAFVPVGMLLVFVRRGVYRAERGLGAVAGLGLLLALGVYALSALVISAYPALPAVVYRTAGVIAGAAVLRWVVRQDPDTLRQRLRGWVPWMAMPYLLGVLLVNQLLSVHWLTVRQAIEQAYPLGLLPLFDYYIVTKAEAAKNIVGHAALYAPIGAMAWLWGAERCGRRAVCLAGVLALAVELARYMRPGLEGDLNAVGVAGGSALLTARLMPAIWDMVRALAWRPGRLPRECGAGARAPSVSSI